MGDNHIFPWTQMGLQSDLQPQPIAPESAAAECALSFISFYQVNMCSACPSLCQRQLQQIASPCGFLVCDGCHRPASWHTVTGPVVTVVCCFGKPSSLLFPFVPRVHQSCLEGRGCQHQKNALKSSFLNSRET